MPDLRDKTIFITGASRGIGEAIALRAARDGANIVIVSKTDQPHPKLPGTIHTVAEEVEAAGGKALAIKVDIRFEDEVIAAVQDFHPRLPWWLYLITQAQAHAFVMWGFGRHLARLADHPETAVHIDPTAVADR